MRSLSYTGVRVGDRVIAYSPINRRTGSARSSIGIVIGFNIARGGSPHVALDVRVRVKILEERGSLSVGAVRSFPFAEVDAVHYPDRDDEFKIGESLIALAHNGKIDVGDRVRFLARPRTGETGGVGFVTRRPAHSVIRVAVEGSAPEDLEIPVIREDVELAR